MSEMRARQRYIRSDVLAVWLFLIYKSYVLPEYVKRVFLRCFIKRFYLK